MSIKPIPDGYHAVTPYLKIAGAAEALKFYKKAFGAAEVMRMDGPGGKVMHAEIQVGDSKIMLADEFPEMGIRSPRAYGGTPVSIHLYVEDVDAVVDRAVAAGATLDRPVEDRFYGDRVGVLTDPFGHAWSVGTHIEDVSPEEMEKRFGAMMKQHADCA